jgi:hypothetical protein
MGKDDSVKIIAEERRFPWRDASRREELRRERFFEEREAP